MIKTSPSAPGSTGGVSLETIHQIRDECLCLASQRAARVLARRFDRLFAPLGLTNGQFSMLVAISGPWKPRLGELADFLAMDQATMTAAAKTLEKRGFLTLIADEKDARARRPVLTEGGRAAVSAACPLWRQEHQKLQSELADTDTVALARILSQLG
jgi:DNA-binding MarR family transcriptional regulator